MGKALGIDLRLELAELVELHGLERMAAVFVQDFVQLNDLTLIDACLREVSKANSEEHSTFKEIFLELVGVDAQIEVLEVHRIVCDFALVLYLI